MPSVHDDILAYLRQQKQMYGDKLYVGPAHDISDGDLPLDSHHIPEAEPVAKRVQQDWTTMTDLASLNACISTCMNCSLGSTRTNFVFGSGSGDADLMIVGEAPGAEEDAQGLPFIGRAGQLLTKILESVDISREDVYICNILKCRPPNNRKPLISETNECEPYLKKQIDIVKPKYILALGLTAANTLLDNKLSMSALRGIVHNYHGIGMIVTYHPAALLRNPAWKRDTWEDVKFLKRLLETT